MANWAAIWPDVTSERGVQRAYELASASAWFLAVGLLVAVIVTMTGHQSRLGYSDEYSQESLLIVWAILALLACTLAVLLRRGSPAAACAYAALVVALFLANGWWGSGVGLPLFIVVHLFALQGVRAAKATWE